MTKDEIMRQLAKDLGVPYRPPEHILGASPPEGFIMLRNKETGACVWSHEKDKTYDPNVWEPG